MSAHTDPVQTLTAEQSWEHLRSQELGRLVTRVARLPHRLRRCGSLSRKPW